MKLKFFVLTMVLCLCIAAVVIAEEEVLSSDAEMPAVLTPQITQVVGETAVTLGPAVYPRFDFGDADTVCLPYLKAAYDGRETNGTADNGFSLAPIYLKSKYGNGYTGGQKRDFEKIEELEKKGYDIPEAYRKQAGILVTWTVRIEGSRVEAGYPVTCSLCSCSTIAHSTQTFPGGAVKTKLYVILARGTDSEVVKPLGPEAVMTIPEGGSVNRNTPGDPTHTGSYLITANDFDSNSLPAKMDLEIRWINETSQQLTSPPKMRNMIITLLPDAGKTQK